MEGRSDQAEHGRSCSSVPQLDEAIAEAFDRSFREALKRRQNVVVEADFGGGR